MQDAISKQAEHMKIVLSELSTTDGIKTYEQFCEAINENRKDTTLRLSKSSVQNWVSGRTEMSKRKAEEIHARFPQYSVEYLRGYAEYPNGKTQLIAEEWKRIHAQNAANGAVSDLVKHAGFEWGSVKDLQPVEGFTLYQLTRLSDGAVREVSQGQFDEFSNEICAYVEMRLNLIFERGHW